MVFLISGGEDRASERLADVTEATQLANHDSNDLKEPRLGFSLPVAFIPLQPDYLPMVRCCSEGLGLINKS